MMKLFIFKLSFFAFLISYSGMNALFGQGACFQVGGDKDDHLETILIPSSNSMLLIGETDSFGPGGQDIYCSAYSSSGVQLWSQAIGLEGDEYYDGSVLTQDNHVVIAGTRITPGGPNGPTMQIVVYKVNFLGNVIWDRTLTCLDESRLICADVIELPNGNVFVAGTVGPNSTEQTFGATLDPSGAVVNVGTLDFGFDHVIQRVVNTADGGIAVVSADLIDGGFYFYKFGIGVSTFIRRITSTNSQQGTTLSGHHIPRDLIEMPNGDFVIVGGQTDDNNDFSIGFIIRTNSLGTPLGWRSLEGNTSYTSGNGNILETVALSTNGNSFIVGGQLDKHKYLGSIGNSAGFPLNNSRIFGLSESIIYDLVPRSNGSVLAIGEDPGPEGMSSLQNKNGSVMSTLANLSNCCEFDERGMLTTDILSTDSLTFVFGNHNIGVTMEHSSVDGGTEANVCSRSFSGRPQFDEDSLSPFQEEGSRIQLYPSLTLDQINIEVPEEYTDSEFVIRNTAGQTIQTGSVLSTRMTIDLDETSSGIYFFQIESNNETDTRMISKKFIVR